MSETDSAAPLAGIRVLDLTMLLPGPFCTRILADFGAEVIKVEPPGGGDWLRHMPPLRNGESILFGALNRGKKSLSLNLKIDEGRTLFLKLAETSDVVLEGFRPGVMERLGVGFESLKEVNPRLIYCSLSGYGMDGPYRNRAGHDLNYVGLTGLLDLNGPRDGPPTVPGTLVADLAGGLWAALGILIGLTAQLRCGRGTRVDGSLLGAAMSFLPVATARQAGGEPMRRGGSELTGGVVCYQIYETRDQKYVTLAALEPKFWEALCDCIELPGLVTAQFSPALPGEPAFETLQGLFRQRTRDEWAATFAGIDACCEPVYSVEEALKAAPVQALQMLAAGGMLPPVREAGWQWELGSTPALGEHTTELLGEIGIGHEVMVGLKDRNAI